MYDGLTLDQLRALVAVVEEGSFSAAARKLKRVQSAVSTSMAKLEAELGVTLWDRKPRVPVLSPQGRTLVAAARRVLGEIDDLRQLTAGMHAGLEPSVSLCLDALFPLRALLDLCTAFAQTFPTVDLQIDTQVMSAVSARVLSGAASLGVVSPEGFRPGLERIPLATVRMLPLVAPSHPLAAHKGRIGTRALSRAVQIVLSERSERGVPDQAVLSARTWRVADLHTKHELLRAGLGWGNLPEHTVREDLARRRLVVIKPASWGKDEHTLLLAAIHRSGLALGPAHQWVLSTLGSLCTREASHTRRSRGQS